jgi:hypothetical protein
MPEWKDIGYEEYVLRVPIGVSGAYKEVWVSLICGVYNAYCTLGKNHVTEYGPLGASEHKEVAMVIAQRAIGIT